MKFQFSLGLSKLEMLAWWFSFWEGMLRSRVYIAHANYFKFWFVEDRVARLLKKKKGRLQFPKQHLDLSISNLWFNQGNLIQIAECKAFGIVLSQPISSDFSPYVCWNPSMKKNSMSALQGFLVTSKLLAAANTNANVCASPRGKRLAARAASFTEVALDGERRAKKQSGVFPKGSALNMIMEESPPGS